MRLFLLVLLWLPVAASAQKTDAAVACKATGVDFVYDCVVSLSRGGKPLTGARLSISADMPSMPMAHNLKPVTAQPGSRPGEYTARLDLEMQGEWALKLRLSGPVRDLIVKKLKFD
jgi:hypothetical protein